MRKNLLNNLPHKNLIAQDIWNTMFEVSGFPEPFIKGEKKHYNRWVKSYHTQIIRDDIREEYSVRQINQMETLYAYLSECIGSPFSASNAARLLKVSHNTILSWMDIFEKFYLLFKLRPYYKRLSRSILKKPKIYIYDYCRIKDPGIKFENMIAVELLRAITLWNDYGLGDYSLHYIRNKEKEEVDFIITENNNPVFL